MINNHFLVANEMVFQQNSEHNGLYCRLIEETEVVVNLMIVLLSVFFIDAVQ